MGVFSSDEKGVEGYQHGRVNRRGQRFTRQPRWFYGKVSSQAGEWIVQWHLFNTACQVALDKAYKEFTTTCKNTLKLNDGMQIKPNAVRFCGFNDSIGNKTAFRHSTTFSSSCHVDCHGTVPLLSDQTATYKEAPIFCGRTGEL